MLYNKIIKGKKKFYLSIKNDIRPDKSGLVLTGQKMKPVFPTMQKGDISLPRVIIGGIFIGLLMLASGVMSGFFSVAVFKLPIFVSDSTLWRREFNPALSILLDITYGIILAGLFNLLYMSIPGKGVLKGIAFGLIIWFFKVVMAMGSIRVMFNVSDKILVYWTFSGLLELLVIGSVLGIFYKISDEDEWEYENAAEVETKAEGKES